MASSHDEMGEAIEPDWSQLYTDLLGFIARRITRRSDFIRFRSVCRRWRSSGDPKLLRPQPPLLLLPRDPASDTCTFFSLSTRELRQVYLPGTAGQVILSAAHGWLFLLDHSTRSVLSMLNPVTGAAIRLPPADDFVGGIHRWCPILWSSPGSVDCFVIVLKCYKKQDHVAFCRPGDEEWAVLTTGSSDYPCDVLYHDGRLLFIDQRFGNLWACDPASPGKPVEVPSLRAPNDSGETSRLSDDFRLLKTENEILLSCLKYVRTGHSHRFSVYTSNLNGLHSWSEVKTIGDNALFESGGQTLMCCLKDFPECKKDCIYMTFRLNYWEEEEDDIEKIYVSDLREGTSESISCGVDLPEGLAGKQSWVTLSLS